MPSKIVNRWSKSKQPTPITPWVFENSENRVMALKYRRNFQGAEEENPLF